MSQSQPKKIRPVAKPNNKEKSSSSIVPDVTSKTSDLTTTDASSSTSITSSDSNSSENIGSNLKNNGNSQKVDNNLVLGETPVVSNIMPDIEKLEKEVATRIKDFEDEIKLIQLETADKIKTLESRIKEERQRVSEWKKKAELDERKKKIDSISCKVEEFIVGDIPTKNNKRSSSKNVEEKRPIIPNTLVLPLINDGVKVTLTCPYEQLSKGCWVGTYLGSSKNPNVDSKDYVASLNIDHLPVFGGEVIFIVQLPKYSTKCHLRLFLDNRYDTFKKSSVDIHVGPLFKISSCQYDKEKKTLHVEYEQIFDEPVNQCLLGIYNDKTNHLLSVLPLQKPSDKLDLTAEQLPKAAGKYSAVLSVAGNSFPLMTGGQFEIPGADSITVELFDDQDLAIVKIQLQTVEEFSGWNSWSYWVGLYMKNEKDHRNYLGFQYLTGLESVHKFGPLPKAEYEVRVFDKFNIFDNVEPFVRQDFKVN